MSLFFARELPSESDSADFKNVLKAPSSLFDFDVYQSGGLRTRRSYLCEPIRAGDLGFSLKVGFCKDY
jgi:hypothetical protein